MTRLENTERPIAADLARRVGVSLTPVPVKAEYKTEVESSHSDTSIGSQTPVLVQTPVSELNKPKPVSGDRPMHANGQQGKAANAPVSLTELAASVLHHLGDVQARNRELTDQLADVMEAHRRDAMELVAAETREMATTEELERALRSITDLRAQLAWSRRSWWKKLWS